MEIIGFDCWTGYPATMWLAICDMLQPGLPCIFTANVDNSLQAEIVASASAPQVPCYWEKAAALIFKIER